MKSLKGLIVSSIFIVSVLTVVAVSQSRRDFSHSSGLSSDAVGVVYLDNRNEMLNLIGNPRLCPLDEEQLILITEFITKSDTPNLISLIDFGSFIVPSVEIENPLFVNGSDEKGAPVYMNSLLAPEISLAQSFAEILSFELSKYFAFNFQKWRSLSESLGNCWKPRIQSYRYADNKSVTFFTAKWGNTSATKIYLSVEDTTMNVTSEILNQFYCSDGNKPLSLKSVIDVTFDANLSPNEHSGYLTTKLQCSSGEENLVDGHFLIKKVRQNSDTYTWRPFFSR